MKDGTEESSKLAESVRTRRRRREEERREGERSLAQNLAMIGMLGWLIVVPTIGGVFLGRWLDHMLDTGIRWTGGFLALGLALGCYLAWRRIRRA
jgi:ATP synthase protein I